MKAVVRPAANDQDLEALAGAFDTLAAGAPEGFDEWAALAAEGASLARGGDVRAARRQCLSCHMKYKRRYQGELRATPWPRE